MSAEAAPRKSVILAAGFGSRIGSGDHGTPKPLMEVSGRTLLSYALDQAAAAKCEEAVIVLGNAAGLVEEYLKTARTPLACSVVHNPDYHHPNGTSLLAAAPRIGGPFFLQMSDHLFAKPVLDGLARPSAAPTGSLRLLVDSNPYYSDDEDATKVKIREGMIGEIGKELPSWDAVDTGCFLLDERIFGILEGIPDPAERSVTAGMKVLARRGELAAVPLEGVRWVDVDTPRDREEAEGIFGAGGPFRF